MKYEGKEQYLDATRKSIGKIITWANNNPETAGPLFEKMRIEQPEMYQHIGESIQMYMRAK